MGYYKLSCQYWGKGNPDFYDVLIKHSIIICGKHHIKKGDYVAIARNFIVLALAQLNEEPKSSKDIPELASDFSQKNIDYEDWNKVANATIWELPTEQQFEFKERKGFCKISKNDIISKIKSLINLFTSNTMIDECKSLLKSNYNLILTGAPGTGKTYLAKEIAKSLAPEDHIGFVQFHPSYDYTDFVEGLRPEMVGSTLGFQRKDGVFKDFCKEALNFLDIDNALNQFIDYVKNNNPLTLYTFKQKKLFDVEYISNKSLIVRPKDSKKNGYDADLNAIKDYIENGTYDPRHETYDPSIGEYIKNKFMTFVFIIDEINRGEISKIFGELFYSIDPGYRGQDGKVKTQYQNLVPNNDPFKDGFYVPNNVYIIGTMNDIDRSVESMDFAMRRRFAWKEVSAISSQSMLDSADAWGGSIPNNLADIKNRMNNLNACIIDKYKGNLPSQVKIGLTEAYQIGASYFLKYRLYKTNSIEMLWDNHLKGVLYEYLRGTTNIEEKMNNLHIAYNDIKIH